MVYLSTMITIAGEIKCGFPSIVVESWPLTKFIQSWVPGFWFDIFIWMTVAFLELCKGWEMMASLFSVGNAHKSPSTPCRDGRGWACSFLPGSNMIRQVGASSSSHTPSPFSRSREGNKKVRFKVAWIAGVFLWILQDCTGTPVACSDHSVKCSTEVLNDSILHLCQSLHQ